MADLIGDDTPDAFSAHPDLPPLLAAELKVRRQALLERGDTATASVLARLAASDAAAGLVRELDRRSTCTGDFLRPTIPVLFWRDLPFRRLLRGHPQHTRALPVFRWAARNEEAARAVCVVELLSGLAEMAMQPDERAVAKVARRARAAAEEWQAAEALRVLGLPQAAGHTQMAFMHLSCAHILARKCPDRDQLLRATCRRLARLFGFRGYRIVAALVSAALDVPISRRHTRYAVRSFSE